LPVSSTEEPATQDEVHDLKPIAPGTAKYFVNYRVGFDNFHL
jgi:hypothetical protein